MIPWERLGSVGLLGGGELRLARRGEEFSIRLGPSATAVGTELMNSRMFGSEEELARLACERLASRTAPEVLIGGLGMGFTLRAAQTRLPSDARILVAELIPAVVEWARGPLQPLFGKSLDDPRVAIHEGDVGPLMRASPGRFDAILLDVDNGPDGLTMAANDVLYGLPGLAMARAALRPGGCLAIWSSHRDDRFAARFSQSGFAVEEHRVAARSGSRAKHVVWLGRKKADAKARVIPGPAKREPGTHRRSR
jgi:spermidine synthase